MLTSGLVYAVDKSVLLHWLQQHYTNLHQLRIGPVEKEKP